MTWCFSQCFCRTWPGVVAEAIPQEFPDKNNLNKALSFLVERSDPQRARDLLRHYFNCLALEFRDPTRTHQRSNSEVWCFLLARCRSYNSQNRIAQSTTRRMWMSKKLQTPHRNHPENEQQTLQTCWYRSKTKLNTWM